MSATTLPWSPARMTGPAEAQECHQCTIRDGQHASLPQGVPV